MQSQIGTSLYMAPEVMEGNYDEKCDFWSLGVILYIMLAGIPPFSGTSKQEIYEQSGILNYEFSAPIWKTISEDAKELIRNLICFEDKRWGTAEIIKCKWFTDNEVEYNIPKMKTDFTEKLDRSKRQNIMRKTIGAFIASRSNHWDIEEQSKAFRALDRNKDGYLTVQELVTGLNGRMTEDEVLELLKNNDFDGNGAINYSEFIAATLSRDMLQDEIRLEQAFRAFDKDGDGKITVAELKKLIGAETKMAHEIIKEIIAECDENNDGMIDIEEFKNCISGITAEDIMIGSQSSW